MFSGVEENPGHPLVHNFGTARATITSPGLMRYKARVLGPVSQGRTPSEFVHP